MSFPANAIGLGAAAIAGGYIGSCQAKTTFDWFLVAALAALAVFFGLILS